MPQNFWFQDNCFEKGLLVDQCYRMATLFVQYLATYNNENLPDSINEFAKLSFIY